MWDTFGVDIIILDLDTVEALLLRDDPFITFAPRGGRGVQNLPKFTNDSTDRLREM